MALPMRPSLQKLHDGMCVTMRNATEKNNASFLVIGDHGTGKTMLIERVLRTLEASCNHGDDKRLAVVRLSGQLHADERTAFQEIARQLCSASRAKFSSAASYDENLAFLNDMLKALHRAMMTVIFVLDEFDLFVRSSSKQLLLYNLMDALTHSGIQAVLVGVTTCFDVLESMEKRVQSRFSHCKLIVKPPTSLRQGDDTIIGLLKHMLQLPADYPEADFAKRYNGALTQLLSSSTVEAALKPLHDTQGLRPVHLTALALGILFQWELQLQALQPVPPAAATAATPVATTAAAAAAARVGGGRKKAVVAGQAVQQPDDVGSTAGVISQAHLSAAVRQLIMSTQGMDVLRIQDLTVLQLFLLAALLRLQQKGTMIATFKMVFAEYSSITVARESHNFTEEAALGAFQLLLDTGLACYVDRRAESRGRLLEYVGVQLRVTEAEVKRGIEVYPSCPTLLQRFLKGEV